jgi:ABC-type nitrate/sulfonate/bicarbonate transport system substrate-binding protein
MGSSKGCAVRESLIVYRLNPLTPKKGGFIMRGRKAFRLIVSVTLLCLLAGFFFVSGRAEAADTVTLRTNWLWYGSHGIFFYGKDKGFYEAENINLEIRQGNGSGNAVRLVANKNDTFAYASSAAMLNLAAKGAPVISRRQRHRRLPLLA